MPLPENNTAWPPPEYRTALRRISEWSAWYGGDPEDLARTYGGTYANVRPSDRPSQYRGGMVGKVARWFWGQPTPLGERRTKLHLPIASDIAATSADLLFSEPVTLEAPEGAAAVLQDRLDELAAAMHAPLLESAEVCAGLGGVFLRAVWDRDVDDTGPWLSPVHADAGVPEWRYGRLVAATLWRVLADDGQRVVRHLERHEPGGIEHAVFEGSTENLGRRVPLTEFAETAPIAEALTDGDRIDTGIDLLTCQYIPNMRPNRLWRATPGACHLGRSDYAGSEPLMDALDEAWSSLMRDMKLAKARAIVASSMLQSAGVGQGAVFDDDREYFTAVDALQRSGDSLSAGIVLDQPKIRVEEHLAIAGELMGRIIGMAGYSGRTFGLADGGTSVTATEVDSRDRKSLITRDKKGLYWLPALRHMTRVLLALGNDQFGWAVPLDEPPTVRLADAVQPTLRERSEAAAMLRTAEAASTQTLVQIVHPDWDDEQVSDEVARILEERGVPAADAFLPADDETAEPEPGEDEA